MLKKQYDEKLAQKEELRKKSEEMELKLERAGMLVSGLAGEKARWEETVQVRWAATVTVPPSSLSLCPLRGNGQGKQGHQSTGNPRVDSGCLFLPFSHLVRMYKERHPSTGGGFREGAGRHIRPLGTACLPKR